MMTTVRQRHIYDNTSPASLTMVSIRNTVPPALRLPLELLQPIFLYCALNSYYGNVNLDIGVPSWVAVSQVCRYWRSVALGYPILWSYMFVACPSWTKVLLARSRGLPLRVRILMSPLNDKMRAFDFLEQVLPHAERFREFRLHLFISFADCIVPLLSPRSVPLLSTLDISFSLFPYTTYRMMEPKDVDHEVRLDDDETSEAFDPNCPFFNEDTPALREFRLKGCPLSWCPPTLGGLTVLNLRSLHWKVRPTIEDITILLGNSPDLVELHLEDAIRGGFQGYDSASLEGICDWVQLPCLEEFSLSAPFSRMVALLSYVDFPATTRLRFRVRLETNPNRVDFPAFKAFLAQRFQDASSFAPIRTLHIRSSGRRVSAFFSTSDTECDHSRCCSSLFGDCRCDIPLKIDVEWQEKTEDWKDLLFGICCSVPLASLEHLILDCRRLPSILWSNVFWHLPRLRYIAFAGLVLTDVLTLIYLPPRPFVQDNVHIGGPVDPNFSQIFAPSLEELYLEGVTIPRARRCGGDPRLHQSYLTVLYNALARRRAVGCPIRRLGISATVSLTPDALEGMKEVCPGLNMVVDSAKFVEEMKGSSCEDCRPRAGACVKEENS